jgi:hypothetical protein
MKHEESLKWPKLIWSIVLVFAGTFIVERFTTNHPSILGVFGFFFVAWAVALLIRLVVFLLRLFRLVGRWSFLYIFTAATTMFLAVCGLWLTRGYTSGFGFWIFLYFFTLAVAALMLIDIYLVEIPGFSDSTKQEKQ